MLDKDFIIREAEIKQGMKQFYGSANLYKYMFGYAFTEGVKYVVNETACYWLLDVIVSYQPDLKNEGFQSWKCIRTDINDVDYMKLHKYEQVIVDLAQSNKMMAVVYVTNGNDDVLETQEIKFTDIELSSVEMYVIDNIILLPTEY